MFPTHADNRPNRPTAAEIDEAFTSTRHSPRVPSFTESTNDAEDGGSIRAVLNKLGARSQHPVQHSAQYSAPTQHKPSAPAVASGTTPLEDHIASWAKNYCDVSIRRVRQADACTRNGVFRVPVVAQLQVAFDQALWRIMQGDKSPFALDELATASLALRGA